MKLHCHRQSEMAAYAQESMLGRKRQPQHQVFGPLQADLLIWVYNQVTDCCVVCQVAGRPGQASKLPFAIQQCGNVLTVLQSLPCVRNGRAVRPAHLYGTGTIAGRSLLLAAQLEVLLDTLK